MLLKARRPPCASGDHTSLLRHETSDSTAQDQGSIGSTGWPGAATCGKSRCSHLRGIPVQPPTGNPGAATCGKPRCSHSLGQSKVWRLGDFPEILAQHRGLQLWVVALWRDFDFVHPRACAWLESLQDSAEACVPMRWKSLACTAALGIASESLEPLHLTRKVWRPDIQCVEPEKMIRCSTHIRACARSASLQ